jgi:hypothetical protein
MTSSLRNTLTATVLFGALACSTGSPNPPQIEGSGEGSGETSGEGSGSVSGTSTGSSGSAAAGSGTTPTSGSSGSATSGSASGTASGASTASGSSTAGSSGSSATGSASGAASGAASGSASGASSGATTPPSFATLYSDLGLCTVCLPCHTPPGGVGYTGGKLDLSTSDNAYTNLVGVKAAGGSCGTVTPALTRVVAGNAMESLFYNKLNAKTLGTNPPCGAAMPKTGDALTTSDMAMIAAWINQGANP